MTDETKKALTGWRQRGYSDGLSGRTARVPLRDTKGPAEAYTAGYRAGMRRKGRLTQ